MLFTSVPTNQRAQIALFTYLVYTNSKFATFKVLATKRNFLEDIVLLCFNYHMINSQELRQCYATTYMSLSVVVIPLNIDSNAIQRRGNSA